MIRLLLALLWPLLAAADWQESLSPPQPGDFPLPAPMVAKYRFGWGAITAAEGTFDFSRSDKGELQLTVETRTTGTVRALWRMNARHSARSDATTLRPSSLEQIEIYKDETLKTKAAFSEEGVIRTQNRVPAEGAPAKEKRFKCPDVFDLHTSLLFVRSQPLRAGDVYRLVVYPAKGPYLATVRALGTDEIKVSGQRHRAHKLEIELQQVTKDLQLQPHRKFKRANAWISDDRNRLLLKIQTEVFVGSVWAELESVTMRDEVRPTAGR